jgi:hypothetical protein
VLRVCTHEWCNADGCIIPLVDHADTERVWRTLAPSISLPLGAHTLFAMLVLITSQCQRPPAKSTAAHTVVCHEIKQTSNTRAWLSTSGGTAAGWCCPCRERERASRSQRPASVSWPEECREWKKKFDVLIAIQRTFTQP